MPFPIASKITPLNPMSNIDKRYGAHASVSAALAATAGTREIGLTVGVIVGGQVVDYVFRSGISDGDLVVKTDESRVPKDLSALPDATPLLSSNIYLNGGGKTTLQAVVDLISAFGASSFKGFAVPATNPATPVANVWYFLKGAGTYTNFLTAPSTPVTVAANDGVVIASFDIGTGYWTKIASAQDLSNYYSIAVSDTKYESILSNLSRKKVDSPSNPNSQYVFLDANNKISGYLRDDGSWWFAGISDVLVSNYQTSAIADTKYNPLVSNVVATKGYNPDSQYVFTDANGKISAYLKDEGTWWIAGISDLLQPLADKVIYGSWQFNESRDPAIAFSVVDGNSKQALTIFADGSVSIPSLKIKNSVSPYFTQLSHILFNGQSLGNGNESVPALTTSPSVWGNLMFSIGIRTWDGVTTGAARLASKFNMVPIVETTNGDLGEIGGVVMTDTLKARLVGVNTPVNPATVQPVFLFSFHGEGGRYLRELDKRHNDGKDARAAGLGQSVGDYYITGIDDVVRAKAYADANGLTYSVCAVCWMQGEKEGEPLVSGQPTVNRWDAPYTDFELFNSDLKTDYINLKNDYQNDIVAITGQFSKPPFLTYKTTGWGSGRAQFELMQTEPDFYMVSALYMLPLAVNSSYISGGTQIWGNWIHLSADGERWLKEQFAKVLKRIVVDNEQWRPLYPKSAKRDTTGTVIDIEFHVPRPPLVLDTSFILKSVDYGFTIYDNGVKKTISKVEVVNGNTVRVTITSALVSPNSTFNYGTNESHDATTAVVASVAAGAATTSGQPTTDVIFTGDVRSQFSLAGIDGAYQIAATNNTGGGVVRKTSLTLGNTYLNIENREIGGAAPAVGSVVKFYKWRAWGNLRDSDPERSLYKFGAAGGRTGNYPLWNWCVDLKNFKIN